MNDRLLWEAMKSGQKTALESIYSREVDYLYNYALRLTYNQDLIKDSIQDLFIEIWNKRTTIGTTDAIRPYLITSLRRKIISTLKKESKTSQDVIEDIDFRSDEAIESNIIKEETAQERSEALNSAMSQLSSRQREAIYHKYYNNHSYEEICKIMDINYQSVRNLISQGIKKMKGFIDDG
ncbi:MAG: RNA polymerase sigma factor [Saprospiraceae bacterium]|nr:RNA polymerase sigma factor [Saprospiraceae bacterium]